MAELYFRKRLKEVSTSLSVHTLILLLDEEIADVQEKYLVPPKKLDENMWRVRQQLEEILYLLDPERRDPVEVCINEILFKCCVRS